MFLYPMHLLDMYNLLDSCGMLRGPERELEGSVTGEDSINNNNRQQQLQGGCGFRGRARHRQEVQYYG